ncbi:MAG: DUF438 domain-containing protein [Sphaerochaetaceae bacterium]|jgi:DUF438 domain-containing protein
MSGEINNSVKRQELLKDLINRLHSGDDFDAVKADFAKEFDGVGADEIAAVEKVLIDEGHVSVAEVQKLCDVHASLFEGSVAEIHADKNKTKEEGHPSWILKEENRAIERLFENRINPHTEELEQKDISAVQRLTDDFTLLWQIDIHYSKKENLWFPIMERYGITAPPQVMWGVDDDIRAMIKKVRSTLTEFSGKRSLKEDEITRLTSEIEEAKHNVYEMISKEENILIPMVSEVFFATDWRHIREQSPEIGYCLLDDHPSFDIPEESVLSAKESSAVTEGVVTLPTGSFTAETLTHVLNSLPVDITFVDANDEVGYFSQASERIFPRTTAIIGRKVANCHPPASVHIVEKIVDDFKSGKSDSEEFYIKLGDKYVYIRYFAVRDENNVYLGTLEVSQNIAPIQQISGEKRLLNT